MWTFIKETLFFAVFIFPALVLNEGHLKLKKFLKKYGIDWDWYYMTLTLLTILLIILLLNGFSW